MKHITSRDNPFFKRLSKLSLSSRERKKQALTLIDGVHLVEVYQQRVGPPEALAVSESGLKAPDVSKLMKKSASAKAVVLADALFKEISSLATPSGIVALVPTPTPQKVPADLALCVLCDRVQDPGNLGSIIRSAAAAGVEHLFLSKECAFAWSPRVIRAGMGAHFLLSIHEGADVVAIAENFRGKVLATSIEAEASVFDTDLSGPLALLIGNEGAGLSAALMLAASQRIKIPMPGGIESLNVAAAAAICLFERVRQTSAKPSNQRAPCALA